MANETKDDCWLLDSGASDHMSSRREWFTDLSVLAQPKCIRIANGERIYAEGQGTIDVLSFNGKSWMEKPMLEVLYVPKLHCNLFSASKAVDRGHEIRSTKEFCELQKDGKGVAVGVREGGLVRLQLKAKVCGLDPECTANAAVSQFSLKVWHERLGHQNMAHVRSFLTRNGVSFIDDKSSCEACFYGKHHRGSFTNRTEKSTKCGEIIHVDLCGPMQEMSIGGSRYYLLFKDDFSHFRFIYCIKQKSEVVEKLRVFVKLAQKQNGHNISIIRSDNGTEFVNAEVKKFLENNGIRHQRTVPYTPEQNGAAERENRTVVEAARTMIDAKQMELRFWAEAVNCAVFVLNRTGASTVADKTPYELWYGKQARFDHLQQFGDEVFVHIPKQLRKKLDPKATKCTFVGYDDNVKGYRVWNPSKGKFEIARDVKFISNDAIELNISSIDDQQKPKEDIMSTPTITIDDSDEEVQENVFSTPNARTIVTSGWCTVAPSNIVQERLREKNDQSSIRAAESAAMLTIGEERKIIKRRLLQRIVSAG